MANQILIASVVVILLVGSYLLLKKKDLKELYTIPDFGVWIFRLVDPAPCGKIIARVQMKKEANGIWYGMPIGANSVYGNVIFKMTFTDTTVTLDVGDMRYEFPRSDPGKGVRSYNYPGDVTFQPEETYDCPGAPSFSFLNPSPDFKFPKSDWDYQGSPYSGSYPSLNGGSGMSPNYLQCRYHSGTEGEQRAAGLFSPCLGGCFARCLNLGLGDVARCTKWCPPA